jgi:hypothetical protein
MLFVRQDGHLQRRTLWLESQHGQHEGIAIQRKKTNEINTIELSKFNPNFPRDGSTAALRTQQGPMSQEPRNHSNECKLELNRVMNNSATEGSKRRKSLWCSTHGGTAVHKFLLPSNRHLRSCFKKGKCFSEIVSGPDSLLLSLNVPVSRYGRSRGALLVSDAMAFLPIYKRLHPKMV